MRLNFKEKEIMCQMSSPFHYLAEGMLLLSSSKIVFNYIGISQPEILLGYVQAKCWHAISGLYIIFAYNTNAFMNKIDFKTNKFSLKVPVYSFFSWGEVYREDQ